MGTKSQLKFNMLNTDLNFNAAYLGHSSIYSPDVNFHLIFNLVTKYYINSKNAISLFYSFKGPRSIVLKNNYGEILAKDIDGYHMLDISYDVNLNGFLDLAFGCNNILNIQNIDAETLISGFHNNESTGIPLSCGRYLYTSIKINLVK